MKQTSRELFKDATSGKKTNRPPVWLMRQAGRFLPEYRELKKTHTFTQIVQTPDLAVEATLQPIRRFDFDCAIIFSDILVVAEALGFEYEFKDTGGIRLLKTVSNEKDVIELTARVNDVCQHLQYVKEALQILRNELPHKAIYGFCGAPWTLACYLVQGENIQGFPKLLQLQQSNPVLFEKMMNALTQASINYANMQLQTQIDAFQVFDSHAGLTSLNSYNELSGKWIAKIVEEIKGKAVSVVFANEMSGRLAEATKTNADFYSLDATRKLSEVRNQYNIGLQGNLPPEILSNSTAQQTALRTKEIIDDMKDFGRHIFNLAHGIKPDAKLENVEAMCQTIRGY